MPWPWVNCPRAYEGLSYDHIGVDYVNAHKCPCAPARTHRQIDRELFSHRSSTSCQPHKAASGLQTPRPTDRQTDMQAGKNKYSLNLLEAYFFFFFFFSAETGCLKKRSYYLGLVGPSISVYRQRKQSQQTDTALLYLEVTVTLSTSLSGG